MKGDMLSHNRSDSSFKTVFTTTFGNYMWRKIKPIKT